MKKLFTFILLACSTGLVYAQGTVKQSRLSAYTRQYLQASASLTTRDKLVRNYVYKKINGKYYISAFIKVYEGIDEGALQALGVYVGTRAGNIWTVQIPTEKVYEFTKVTGISDIDLDMPIVPALDAARKLTKADSAQSGINLPMPMTGKGVIMGVIDAGFDFTHPTMYDTTHSAYRIKRVWTQKVSGTPPSGFAYGNEMTDTNVIRARGTDTALISHGTHVTGIAAGSGYGGDATNRRYRGMAFESDIVMVGIMPAPDEWLVAGESDIVDGMSYIYTYAGSVSKPAVINLSWGSTIGSHDGTSLFSQACDALTGPGKIFVCAAGNNGMDTVHIGKTFTTIDTMVSTFVTFSPYLDTLNQKTWVDVWGDTGKTFCINFKLYDTVTRTAIDSTTYLCIADTTKTFYLIGSNHDTCFATVTMVDTEYNGRPHALVYLYSRVHDQVCMNTKATAGSINMWEGYVLPPEGYYGALKKLGYSWAVSGDVRMTVSDIGCTKSALTVGAFASKLAFRSITGPTYSFPGTVYKIASFSSLGPTADNRIKPDIAAPGLALASSLSSYDTTNNSGGSNYISVVVMNTFGSRNYPYGMEAGTSMASPCAAGISAMMLQLYPLLTPDSLKHILALTAIKDTFTSTTIPPAGNTTWGHGKINAYKALRYMAGTLSVQNTLTADPLDCILYPNPNKGSFTVDFQAAAAEQLTVSVYDISGRLMKSEAWFVNKGANSHVFSSAGLAKGVYFTKISSATGRNNVIRMIVE